MFEIGYFEECISFYDAFCIEHDWEHSFDVPEAQINDYFYKHQHQKLFQHARTFAAVIGSYLALDNYEKAYQLYKEMDFWGVVPLRETFYHFMDVGVRGLDVNCSMGSAIEKRKSSRFECRTGSPMCSRGAVVAIER